jgi:hypothetical protein
MEVPDRLRLPAGGEVGDDYIDSIESNYCSLPRILEKIGDSTKFMDSKNQGELRFEETRKDSTRGI